MGPLNVSSISRRHGPSVVHLAPRNDVAFPLACLLSLPPAFLLLAPSSGSSSGRGPRGELIIANIYSGLVTARSGE